MKISIRNFVKGIIILFGIALIAWLVLYLLELRKLSGKKAISFGLYGNNPLYTMGALRNAELAPEIYPGWTAVFYVDQNTVPSEIIQGLKNLGATVITEGEFNNTMFGRFMIADNEEFDYFIVRDVDSRLSTREAIAVEEWIKNGKPMHTIRDHEEHGLLVLGGLWGGKRGLLGKHKMYDLVSQWSADKSKRSIYKHFTDQELLVKIVRDIVKKKNLLAHDSYHCKIFPGSIPLARPSMYKDFMGQAYSIDENFKETPMYGPGADGPPECNPSLR